MRDLKRNPIDVIAYEIDMLHHSFGELERVMAPLEQAPTTDEGHRRREALTRNAWIECYLLHYRNLVEFFVRRVIRPRKRDQELADYAEDLVFRVTRTWTDREVPPDDFRAICELADDSLGEYWDEISRYLQHCTDWRYKRRKCWQFEKMDAELAAALHAFQALRARIESV